MQEQYAVSRGIQGKEDEMLEEVLKNSNDGYKEKKLKELLTRNKHLTIQHDKEKTL